MCTTDKLDWPEPLSTEARREKLAGQQLCEDAICARPGCDAPMFLHDVNDGVPGGACLCGVWMHCPEFVGG